MKTKLLTLVALAISCATFGQAPEAFKYQAVVRNASGAIIANQAVGYQLTILQGSPAGTTVYTETFTPTSNNYGLVNLEIGTGNTVDDFSAINWANGPYYIETAADLTGGTSYVVMGTSQLVSVPYALYAKTAENVTNDQVDDADADPTNEIQDISLTGTDLSISGGSTVDLSGIGGGTDDQTLTLTGTDLSIESGNTVDLSTIQDGTGTDDQTLTLIGTDLSIESGNTLDLSVLQDGVTDADADPANELQSISLAGETLSLSNGGGSVSINDADADPANELQNLGLTGTTLSISSGNSVDLAVIQDGTGTDDQTLSLAGNALSIESGNSVDLSGYLDNTDAQTLSLTGSDLSISGGNTITLPDDNDWIINGNDLYNANTGNVGIGTMTPNYALHTHTDVNSIHQFTTTSTGTSVLDGFLIGNNSLNDAYIIQRENANLFIRTNNTDRITIDGAGNVGVGTSTPAAVLDVTSTTSGVIMPRMTAAQRDAIATPVNGMMVYNTDEDCMNVYQASVWQSLCGGSGGGSGSNQDTLIYTTDGF